MCQETVMKVYKWPYFINVKLSARAVFFNKISTHKVRIQQKISAFLFHKGHYSNTHYTLQ